MQYGFLNFNIIFISFFPNFIFAFVLIPLEVILKLEYLNWKSKKCLSVKPGFQHLKSVVGEFDQNYKILSSKSTVFSSVHSILDLNPIFNRIIRFHMKCTLGYLGPRPANIKKLLFQTCEIRCLSLVRQVKMEPLANNNVLWAEISFMFCEY